MNEDRDRLEFVEQLSSLSKLELWALLTLINFMIFRNRLRALFPTTAARLVVAGLAGMLAALVWLAL